MAGRPAKLTPDIQQKILRDMASGVPGEVAAQAAGNWPFDILRLEGSRRAGEARTVSGLPRRH
jgi:hypothetical protein